MGHSGPISRSRRLNQSVIDEAAVADGLESATAFVDLAKAFERIRLEDVWRAGVRHGFPLHVLRLALEAFAFARRLSFQGVVSDPTLTLSAVLAGGGFAQVALHLLLQDPIVQVQATYTDGITICLCLTTSELMPWGTKAL